MDVWLVPFPMHMFEKLEAIFSRENTDPIDSIGWKWEFSCGSPISVIENY